jgi:hypothetical protein
MVSDRSAYRVATLCSAYILNSSPSPGWSIAFVAVTWSALAAVRRSAEHRRIAIRKYNKATLKLANDRPFIIYDESLVIRNLDRALPKSGKALATEFSGDGGEKTDDTIGVIVGENPELVL